LFLVRLANGDGCYTPMRVFLTETRNILSIEAQQNFVGATPAALFHYPITVHARDSVSRCVHYTVIGEMSSNRQRACRVGIAEPILGDTRPRDCSEKHWTSTLDKSQTQGRPARFGF